MIQETDQERRPVAAYVLIAVFALTVAAVLTSLLTAGL